MPDQFDRARRLGNEREHVDVSDDVLERLNRPRASLKVSVSWFEWIPNRSGLRWTADEVRHRPEARMLEQTALVPDLADELDTTVRTPAHAQGLRRIAEAVDPHGTAALFGDGKR